MIDYISGWRAYVDASEKYSDQLTKIGNPENYEQTLSISESIFDATTKEMTKTGTQESVSPLKLDLYGKKPKEDTDRVEVRKYEYIYGAYNIDIRKIWYLETGEYISPQYEANGTVIEARLDVTEVVPSGTSIEYQLATRANDWKNILPSGGYITKERIDFDGVTQEGFVRFPCSGSLSAMYRNETLIPPADYVFTPSTNKVVMGSGWYTATSAFTTSYIPKGTSDVTPSGVNVSFMNDPLQEAEEMYSGTESRQYKITLEHFPYVNYNILNDTSTAGATSPHFSYEDGTWLNLGPNTYWDVTPGGTYHVVHMTVDGYDAVNRTDYYENIRPALTTYDPLIYPYYEFIHAGKNIYFNTELKNKNVKAKYLYLNDFIQLRALLRNNLRGNVSLTPRLDDFTIKLRTI
jgi:hypothetical protein